MRNTPIETVEDDYYGESWLKPFFKEFLIMSLLDDAWSEYVLARTGGESCLGN